MFEHLKKRIRGSSKIMDFYFLYKLNKITTKVNVTEGEKIILCRSACLGHYILDNKYSENKNIIRVNQQKVRIDFLNERLHSNTIPRTKSSSVMQYLREKEKAYVWIQEQEYLPWLTIQNFDYIMFDSFADLGDRKFIHKNEGWEFCAYGTDIHQDKKFKETFENLGLLAIEKINTEYLAFFSMLEKKYPGKHIFFVHYSAELDDRPMYRERAAIILDTMKEIAKNNHYVHNIFIDDSMVEWEETDQNHYYPYHYSKETIAEYVERWKAVEKEINITF